jgi:DNA-binding transcriptional LysR family regulator
MAHQNFTLKQLGYLVTVSETGSVTEAARIMNVSQPSISSAIAHLEAVFGMSLFVRKHAKGLNLTAEGRAIVASARRVIEEAEQLGDFVDEMSGEVTGTIEVGCVLTLAPIILPSIIAEFGQLHPKAKIKAHGMNHHEMIEALSEGQMSVALTYDLPAGPEYDFEPLHALESYALVSASHPLAKRGHASLHELAESPLILLDLPATADFFEGFFRLYDVQYRIAHRSSSPHMVRAMVANGLGFSLFNAPLLDDRAIDGRPLRRIQVSEKLPVATLGILTHRERTLGRAASQFRDFARENVRL